MASVYPFAAQGLRFYAQVTELQSTLYANAAKLLFSSTTASPHSSLREELANPVLLTGYAQFLKNIRQFAPEPLADAAAQLAGRAQAVPCRPINDFLAGGFNFPVAGDETNGINAPAMSAQEGLLAWLFLQPFAEFLAGRREPAKTTAAPLTCPMCGSNPIVGVLRPEGDGGKKSLVCMLCAHEWAFRRIYCPACGEGREPQMGFFTAPEVAHVRVDVCDTCHVYLKTVDLTKAGLAVPVVDELAAIPLDLWAREHGYEKLQINSIGA